MLLQFGSWWLLGGICIFFFLQLGGPFFSVYRYDFKEDGLRISVRFLGIIPMPGTTLRYERIYDIKRLNRKSHLVVFITVSLLEFFGSMFTDTLIGPFFMEWGNVWKKENGISFHYGVVAQFADKSERGSGSYGYGVRMS